MRPTVAGLILEKIFKQNKHRYLLCWNGEPEDYSGAFDCGCCLTWGVNEDGSCGCVCHERIQEMASLPHIKLWLVSMQAMDALPFFPNSFAEDLAHKLETYKNHKKHWTELNNTEYSKRKGLVHDCNCSDCEYIRNYQGRCKHTEGFSLTINECQECGLIGLAPVASFQDEVDALLDDNLKTCPHGYLKGNCADCMLCVHGFYTEACRECNNEGIQPDGIR